MSESNKLSDEGIKFDKPLTVYGTIYIQNSFKIILRGVQGLIETDFRLRHTKTGLIVFVNSGVNLLKIKSRFNIPVRILRPANCDV